MTAIPITNQYGSKNNLYDADEALTVVSRYMKSSVGSVSGWRYDPNTNERIDFLLKTHPEDFDSSSNGASQYRFRYNSDVIELYSQEELTYFLAANAGSINAGKLLEYDDRVDGTVTTYNTHVTYAPSASFIGIQQREVIKKDDQRKEV